MNAQPNCLHCDLPIEDGALFCGHCGEPIPVVSPSHDPFIGRVVSRNYRIVKRIAQGGMGVVYLARHEELGQRVAVKFLHRRFADDEELATRFFNEARAASKVSHPYAVGIYDFARLEDGTLFIVMEYVDGTPLHELIQSRNTIEAPLAVALALRISQVLDVAHEQHLVHRDIKPDNIMVIEGRDGDPTVKVLDFGIAKILDDDSSGGLTQTGMMFGTPEYMSPEQASGSTEVDHRSDIYSLGLVMYEMIVGHPPFRGRNKLALLQRHVSEAPAPVARAANKRLPESLSRLIMSCLEKSPDKRPQSMMEVGEQLREVEATLGRPTAPSNSGKRRILTHGAEDGPEEPYADQASAIGVTETDYELGADTDARSDSGAFSIGDVADIETGHDLGGFTIGDDEFDDFHDQQPSPAQRRQTTVSGRLVVLVAVVVVVGVAFALRAMDRAATPPDESETALVADGSADGSADGTGETSAEAPAEAAGGEEEATNDRAEAAPTERARREQRPRERDRTPPAPAADDEPAAAPVVVVNTAEDAPRDSSADAAADAVAAAIRTGDLDRAEMLAASIRERNPERSQQLTAEVRGVRSAIAGIESELSAANCLRADEQVIALREDHGRDLAAQFYGRLSACSAAAAERSPPAEPLATGDRAAPPARERAREPARETGGRVLPPPEL
jgi:serine/threonine protein kinase